METFIHKTADVSNMATIGHSCKVWHHTQIREDVTIGESCTIGKGVYIDSGVTIGNRVKIQNGVSVYKGVMIEDDVLLGPNCTFTNDPYPRSFPSDWEILPTYLRKGCSIGANATIVCGITIGEFALVGAGAVLTNDTMPHAMMVGNPARFRCFVCTCGRELRQIQYKTDAIEFSCPKCNKILHITFNR